MKKKRYKLVEHKIAKSSRASFVYFNGNQKGKIYQCFNEEHSFFVSNVLRDAKFNFFPKINNIIGDFIDSCWVEGDFPNMDKVFIEKKIDCLYKLYEHKILESSYFDFLEDFLVPRFLSLRPLVNKKTSDNILMELRFAQEYFGSRISHPDLHIKNFICDNFGRYFIIDNELLNKTKHHRLDLLNMLYHCPKEYEKYLCENFISNENRIGSFSFKKEIKYLEALWTIRQAGACFVARNIKKAIELINDYETKKWILPFDRSCLSE